MAHLMPDIAVRVAGSSVAVLGLAAATLLEWRLDEAERTAKVPPTGSE